MGISKQKRKAPSERTLQMGSWAVRQLKAGKELPPPKDLAKKFDLSTKTVLKHLGEIAAEANVSRDSLLERPKSKYSCPAQGREPLENVISLEEFHEKYVSVMEDIHGMIETVEADVQRQEDLSKQYEGGM